MSEPVNAVGATEAEWNDWIARSAAWEAANPGERPHKPHEVCDCEGLPLPRSPRRWRGHCAAVGPIVPWKVK
jgi:hypothetical protein